MDILCFSRLLMPSSQSLFKEALYHPRCHLTVNFFIFYFLGGLWGDFFLRDVRQVSRGGGKSERVKVDM